MAASLNKSGSSPGAHGLSLAVPALACGLFGVVPAAVLLLCMFPSRSGPAPALTFTQLKPRFPALGLFPSAVLHATVILASLCPPLVRFLTPPRIVEVRWNDLAAARHDRIVMTKIYYSPKVALPPAPASGPSARRSSEDAAGRQTDIPSAQSAEGAMARSTYSGPQELVSLSPNPTNSIQTILRPDLVNPTALKSPQLLKPVVLLTSSVPPGSEALLVPAEPINNTSVDLPAAKIPSTVPPLAAQIPRRPHLEIDSDAASNSTVAGIVINAVMVPENAPIALPQAELAGSFAVRPVHSVRSTGDAGRPGGSAVSSGISGSSKGENRGAQGKAGEAAVPHSEPSTRNGADGPALAPKSPISKDAANQDPNRFSRITRNSQVANVEVSSQSARGVSGITIIGGTIRSGSSIGAVPTTGAKYGLTVISSGTSGGASRDLGVFDRSEIVYTVFIPMADAGGGPDWSIQYAIRGASDAGNGLLAPPVPVKKVRAVVAGYLAKAGPTIIFFSGVISANGELTIKSPPQIDARSRQALDALRQWKFLPAQLNGIAVEIKVLIGVGTV